MIVVCSMVLCVLAYHDSPVPYSMLQFCVQLCINLLKYVMSAQLTTCKGSTFNHTVLWVTMVHSIIPDKNSVYPMAIS